MASVISGFDNDIFISYRQNDNKVSGAGDGWVTEFVNQLSDELEATVKGKVTIYFDKNPHDGLLETHSVDESLANRLKSLIFIPIVSQTYCDPGSFAWQNEFLPFIHQAAKDKFSLSVKLPNGNIASRVLPVRIHELDSEDLKLLESELKGKLRPVDFIFKSPGVNRPLRAHEEDPLKNSNHSLYRDQINKTANAIKDLVNGFRNFENASPEKTKTVSSIPSVPAKTSGSLKAIAVLPFVNGGNQEDKFLGEGLAEELLNSLALIRGIKVVPRAASFPLGNTHLNLPVIAETLGAGKVIEGTVITRDGRLEVIVKISNTDNGSTHWSNRYEQPIDGLPGLVSKIALTIIEKLNVPLKETEKNLITGQPTPSVEAYIQYLRGRFHWHRKGEGLMKSLTYFQKAIELDRDFSLAQAGVANAYVLLGYYQLVPFNEALAKSKEAAMKALRINPSLTEAWSALAFINMSYEWNWPEAEQYFNKVFAINPAHPSAKEKYDRCLQQIKANFEEAEVEPLTTIPYFLQAFALLHRGKFEEAMKAAAQAVDHDPNSFMAQRALGLSYMGLEKYNEAIVALQKAASLSNRHHWLMFELMGAFMLAGKIEEAHGIMEETLSDSNALPSVIHNFFFAAGQ